MRFATFSSWLLTFAAASALDLTPVETTRDLEGFKIPILEFADGRRKARWQPPAGWSYRFSEKRLQFTSKDVSGAFFDLRTVARLPEEKLGTQEALVEYAKAFFPASFRDPAFSEARPSPFLLEGIETVELEFKATEFGRAARGSVFLANLTDKERFIVVLTARETDFRVVRDEIVASFTSWSWETRAN